MFVSRRTMIGGAAAAMLLSGRAGKVEAHTMEEIDESQVYGLIGQMKAAPGRRDELIGYLIEGSAAMPGNLGYGVWKDLADADAIWITEVWKDEAAHKASLHLPQVQEAIRKARPIIAGFGARAEVSPVAGTGPE